MRNSIHDLESLLRRDAARVRDDAPERVLSRALLAPELPAPPEPPSRPRRAVPFVPMLLIAGAVGTLGMLGLRAALSPRPVPRPPASAVLSQSLDALPRSARRLSQLGADALPNPRGVLPAFPSRRRDAQPAPQRAPARAS